MTPTVSILVPTYNRRKFIPLLLRFFDQQTFPHDDMELIIADDGDDPVEDLLSNSRYHAGGDGCIRYHRLSRKITIGEKRNFLNDQARGQFIITMDDDDWYGPEYVTTMVRTLRTTDKLICGASAVLCYFPQLNKILQLGPFDPNHTCNHLMGYKRTYLSNHRYDDSRSIGEEPGFTNDYSEPLEQIPDSGRFFLLISHATNTGNRLELLKQAGLIVDLKRKTIVVTKRHELLQQQGQTTVAMTNLRIGSLIKDQVALRFYKSLKDEAVVQNLNP